MIKNSNSRSAPRSPAARALAWLPLVALSLSCAEPTPPQDELQGVVELHERALGFEVSGRLAELRVHKGERVQPGQVLAVLDDGLERPQREARAADLMTAKAQLALLEAGARSEDLRASEAQVRSAKATESTLADNARRIRELAASGTVPPQQLDEIEGQLARAKADREAAEQRLLSLRAGARRDELKAARARADSAEAALALVDTRLGKYVVKAPVAGAILDTHAEPGEVLGAGAPVVTLGETQRPYVDLFVPEASVGGIRPGSRASVRIDAEQGRSFDGAVEDVGQRTEFTPRFLYSPKERPNLVVRVRVALRDPDERLRAGVPAFGRIERDGAPPGAGAAPARVGEVGGLRLPKSGSAP
jgi:HlyD family secretion protein